MMSMIDATFSARPGLVALPSTNQANTSPENHFLLASRPGRIIASSSIHNVIGHLTVKQLERSPRSCHVTVIGGEAMMMPRWPCVCGSGGIGFPLSAPHFAGSLAKSSSVPASSIVRTSQLSPPLSSCWFGHPFISTRAVAAVSISISKPVCIEPPACAPPAGIRITRCQWFTHVRRTSSIGTRNCRFWAEVEWKRSAAAAS
mmetsp:Transcript_3377/g.7350  ORF Transcript_3377/g.7350 Transcript_3377/m.7350 type:complete len:202 (+) Transcript_3377:17-622(+)